MENLIVFVCWIIMYMLTGFKPVKLSTYAVSQQNLISVSSIINEIPSDTTNLILSDNYLQTLSDYTLSNLTSLTKLELNNNHLRNLSSLSLQGTLLQELDLSENRLSAFPNLSVVSETLVKLDLSNNYIDIIHCERFQELTYLRTLDLEVNQITTLPGCCQSDVSMSLQNLYVRYNNISLVTESTFFGLGGSLRKIYLEGYTLQSHGHLFIQKLPQQLRYLFMQEGDLNDSEVLAFGEKSDLKDLLKLIIMKNYLSKVPVIHPNSTQKLNDLDLRHNQITELSHLILDNYPSLKILRLSGNKLMYIPQLTSFPQHPLEQISINVNQITNISIDIFNGLTSLKNFYGHVNSITPGVASFPLTVRNINIIQNNWESLNISMLSELVQLKANENNLKCVYAESTAPKRLELIFLGDNQFENCSFRWLSEITTIELLYLYNSQQKAFPNVTQSATSVTGIHIQQNDISEIPQDLLNGFTALEILNIGTNALLSIPLMRQSPISKLSAQKNMLQHFPDLSGAMNNTLQKLYLDNNQIKMICHDDIHMLHALETLTLNKNEIKSVVSLTMLSNLGSVDLRANSLICDCSMAWIKQVTYVSMSTYSCSSPSSLETEIWESEALTDALSNCSMQVLTCPITETTPSQEIEDYSTTEVFTGVVSSTQLLHNSETSISSLSTSDFNTWINDVPGTILWSPENTTKSSLIHYTGTEMSTGTKTTDVATSGSPNMQTTSYLPDKGKVHFV